MNVQVERVVGSTTEAVSACLADYGRWTTWMPGVMAVEDQGVTAGGRKLRVRARAGKKEVFSRIELATDAARGTVRMYVVRESGGEADAVIEVSAAAQGARVRYSMDLQLPAAARLFGPIIRGAVRKDMEGTLAALDKALRGA